MVGNSGGGAGLGLRSSSWSQDKCTRHDDQDGEVRENQKRATRGFAGRWKLPLDRVAVEGVVMGNEGALYFDWTMQIPAAPAPAPAPVVVAAPTAEKVTFAADAFFDFDKSVLKPDGKAKLDDMVSKLSGVDLEVIIAVGHTDSIGSDAYNQKLSIRRAEAVKAYLVSKGIENNRVYTEGKGKKQPVASNKTAAGRAKNRRVEIEVVGTRNK